MFFNYKNQKKELARQVFSRSRRGFTMIELLIVTLIVFLMTGALVSALGKNKNSNEVELAAFQVVSQLRSLQNGALSGKSISGTVICHFQFDIAAGAKFYTSTYKDCATTPNVIATTSADYLSAKKEGGSVTAASVASFSFAPPLGAVNAGQITLTSGSSTYYVCVETSGSILAQKTACP